MSDTIPAEPAFRPPPRLRLSGAQWKLGLAAVLGAAFTLSWFAVETPEPAAAPPRTRGGRARVAQAPPPPPRQARGAWSAPRSPRAARIRTRSS